MKFLEKLEAIPAQYRWAMIPGVLLLLGVVYWYFLYQPSAEAITRIEAEITRKRATLREHRQIAAQYDKFRALEEELEVKLRQALVKLPNSKEIPALIRQISDLGVRAGLQITLLRPQAEKVQEFYAEVPLTMKMVGHFHAVGQFFDALARLPRIVSVSQVQMSLTTKSTSSSLTTQCLATTFRFLHDDEDGAAPSPSKGQRKKKQRKT